MEDLPEDRPLREGWEAWKESIASFLAAIASLASARLSMARLEAREWSRAFVIRLGLIAGALFLLLFVFALLTAGLVAAFQLWTGSLVWALFIVLGIFLIAAGALIFAASRSRASRPVFEATMREVKKDFESFTGGAE